MDSAGAKLAGAAQRRTRKGILHQGSVVITSLPPRKIVIAALQEKFEEMLAYTYEPFPVREEFIAAAENLAKNKYSTEKWNEYAEVGDDL